MEIMSTVLTVVHILVCVILIAVILLQAGRGGGLVSNFSFSESIFGTQSSAFMQKATTTAAILFMLTCLGLAFINAQKSKSLVRGQGVMSDMVPLGEETQDVTSEAPETEEAQPTE